MLPRRLLAAGIVAAIPPPRMARAQDAAATRTLGSSAGNPASPAAIRDAILMAGAFARQSSDLAQNRSTSAALRQFAEFESEEQQATLRALLLAGMPAPVAVPLSETDMETMRRLREAEGAAFDRLYLDAQLAGHEALLRLHGGAAEAAQMPGERAVSTLAVPLIRSHVAMLEGLRSRQHG